ncbi:hypothetical protein AB0N51_40740, partial [Streptomyces sp. NPDC052507]|uniref:hypothetical protein n=1 Tax=Streptomyces sp. NPDC052507 TaxID=3161008 RepID=UPI003429A94E
LTAPHGPAQQRVIRQALAARGLLRRRDAVPLRGTFPGTLRVPGCWVTPWPWVMVGAPRRP